MGAGDKNFIFSEAEWNCLFHIEKLALSFDLKGGLPKSTECNQRLETINSSSYPIQISVMIEAQLPIYSRGGEPLAFQMMLNFRHHDPWPLVMLARVDGSSSSAMTEGPKVPHCWPTM